MAVCKKFIMLDLFLQWTAFVIYAIIDGCMTFKAVIQ